MRGSGSCPIGTKEGPTLLFLLQHYGFHSYINLRPPSVLDPGDTYTLIGLHSAMSDMVYTAKQKGKKTGGRKSIDLNTMVSLLGIIMEPCRGLERAYLGAFLTRHQC